MSFSDPKTNPIRFGDPSAFDRLYAAFAPRVLAYLLRLTGGSRSEAEDLTQETFLAAYSSRSDFPGSNPLIWLFGVARRRQRDAFRASTARPATTSIESDEIVDSDGPVSETVTRRIVLQNALDKLDTPERDAILLVVVQGLTYAEASRVMDEPVGTVKWRVHTGTKRLRHLLSSTFSEEYTPETIRKETVSYVETEHAKTATI